MKKLFNVIVHQTILLSIVLYSNDSYCQKKSSHSGAGKKPISEACASELISTTNYNTPFFSNFSNASTTVKVKFQDVYALIKGNLGKKLIIHYGTNSGMLYMIWEIESKGMQILDTDPSSPSYHSFKPYDEVNSQFISNYETIRTIHSETKYSHFTITQEILDQFKYLDIKKTSTVDINYMTHSITSNCIWDYSPSDTTIGVGQMSTVFKYYGGNTVQYRDASHTFPPYP